MTQSKSRQPVVPGSTGTYAVLPLRDIVVFPHMIVPLFVGREKSIRALEEVVRTDSHILLATQINAGDDDPATDAIYKIGTLASVLQLLKLPDGTVKVLVEGVGRAKVTRLHPLGRVSTRPRPRPSPTSSATSVEAEALARSVRLGVRELREAEQEDLARGRLRRRPRSTSRSKLADTIASHLRGQDRRQAGDPGDPDGREAPGEGARADGERDLRAAGGEAHPHPRQAADGEDPARVLPQRADEGDPEGAGRRGRHATSWPSSRSGSRRPSSPRKPATRRRPS